MRCYLCRRPTLGDDLAVTLDGAVRDVCSTCWSRQDVELPLDMTEDEEFQNREGQPEWNGAFR